MALKYNKYYVIMNHFVIKYTYMLTINIKNTTLNYYNLYYLNYNMLGTLARVYIICVQYMFIDRLISRVKSK